MKVIKQVFQGITSSPEYVVDVLRLLDQHDVKELLLISSAYIRSTGTKRLEDVVELNSFKSKVAFVGVNNQSSSIQGVSSLMSNGFDTFAVDTNRRDAIFHPKVFLARGNEKAIFITGSANLTGQGLTKNFEHVLALEFDLKIDCDREEVDKLESTLMQLPELYPEHVLLSSHALLDNLLMKGKLENEMVFKHSAETKGMSEREENDLVGIKIPPPPSLSNKVQKKEEENEIAKEKEGLHSELGSGVLVWKKNKLSKSDAQISGGGSTNVKGYMTMGNKSYRRTPDGRLVDNKTYMKEDIFGDLPWAENPTIDRDEVFANFEFWLDGEFIETKLLMITDKESRDPKHHGGEDQKQPTTALHVCGFNERFQEVLGKDLTLFKLDINTYRIEVA